MRFRAKRLRALELKTLLQALALILTMNLTLISIENLTLISIGGYNEGKPPRVQSKPMLHTDSRWGARDDQPSRLATKQ